MTHRVRFAPSPTGYLHVGSARTALYNFLFARHEKATFILRVEDTDQQRNTEASLQTILDGMKWLGLSCDEGPYYQSKRLDLYKAWAARLEKEGKAYWLEDPVKGKALYFKIPRDQKVTWDDLVLSKIEIDPAADTAYSKDLVILKSDGYPTYNFACVVDDADLKITHVIRGSDHVPNTPKQLMLYKAFGVEPPKFAHIPLIYDPKGEKISKRKTYDFPVTIEQTQQMGYLPDAFINFLALLGWSPGHDIEVMTMAEMIEKFTPDRINQSPARYLRDKLDWMNGMYIRKMPIDRLVELCKPFLKDYDLSKFPAETVKTAIAQQHERLKRLDEIGPLTKFIFAPIVYEQAAVDKWLKNGGKDVLTALRSSLSEATDYGKDPIDAVIKTLAEKRGVKLGAVAQPLRVALTGGTVSPPIHDVLSILGKETVLQRLDKALELA